MKMKSNFGNAAVAVHGLAQRSSRFIYGATFLLALAPLFVHLIMPTQQQPWVLFAQGLWVPFCFLVFPTIYNLCRLVVWLEGRVDELERERSRAG